MKAIGELMEGPLDIVGDVHGEISALRQLMAQMGYNREGKHPKGRKLVFVGDLGDRGEDSPAVFELVGEMVEGGRAQMVLGNHELNILRGSEKPGNGWFFDKHEDHEHPHLKHAPRASASERTAILDFLDRQPLALSGEGLRVVHACWDPEHVDTLSREGEGARKLYTKYEDALAGSLKALKAAADAEEKVLGPTIKDKNQRPRMNDVIAEYEETYQMGNPVRVLTSGVERRGTSPFFAGGKWRFVERAAWWKKYDDPVPVVVGHYWRWKDPAAREGNAKDGPDLFEGVGPEAWMGKRNNVFCVDYSAGHRYTERGNPLDQWISSLAALRWDGGKSSVVHDPR